MKRQSDRTSLKEFLKLLRPELRPSLARKQFFGLLCSMKRKDLLDEVQGVAVSRLERIEAIQNEPERFADELDTFWKYRGTSLDSVEKRVSMMANRELESYKTNGFGKGMPAFLKTEYEKWRSAETSRRRASAARIKAVKEAAAKVEAEKLKSEKALAQKLAQQGKPHITKGGNLTIEKQDGERRDFFETAADSASYEEWVRTKDAEPDADETASNE